MSNEINIPGGQEGSGSAENQGRSRQDQLSQSWNEPENQQELRDALGNDADRLGSLKDTGALSGRDDAAGGSGDRMEDQHTGQGTDR